MDKNNRFNFELIAIVAFLIVIMVAIFFVDIITPKGFLNWFFYLVIIFYTSFKLQKKYLVIFGFAGVGLTVMGFFLSPVGVSNEVALLNRIIGILLIWMLTSILYKHNKDRELKEETEKQFGIFLNKISTIGIVYFDTDGKITILNKKFADVLGYRIDEIINRNILEFIHPIYRKDFLLSKEKIYLNLRKSDLLEEKLIKKDRGIVSVDVELNITQSNSNDSRYFIAYFKLIEKEEETADFILGNKILIREISG